MDEKTLKRLKIFKKDKDLARFLELIKNVDMLESVIAILDGKETSNKEKKQKKRLLVYKKDKVLAQFIEQAEISDKTEQLLAVLLSMKENDVLKGDKGEKGDPGKDGLDGRAGRDGKDGKAGRDGKDGLEGKAGRDGKDGKDGLDGKDGKDADIKLIEKQLPKPSKVARSLEDLRGKAKLDYKALKNKPDFDTLVKNVENKINSMRGGGGGGMLEVYSNGTKVNSSHRINFTGATVTNEGGRTNVAITPGGVSSVSSGHQITIDNTDPANPIVNLDSPLLGTGESVSVDYEGRKLQDTSENNSVDWENRILYNSANDPQFDWDNLRIVSFGNGVLYTKTGGSGTGYLGVDSHFTYDDVNDVLHTHKIAGDATDGLLIESANGTDVGILGPANTANVTWYGSHNFNPVTASRVAQFSASKTLESSSVTTTELGYLSGVTSAIQTQIDNLPSTLDRVCSAFIESPVANDAIKLFRAENDLTIAKVVAFTDTGTVTFNIEERASTTPNTAGTDIMTSDLVADSDTQTSTTFSNAGISAGNWVTLVVTSIATSPTILGVEVIFNED